MKILNFWQGWRGWKLGRECSSRLVTLECADREGDIIIHTAVSCRDYRAYIIVFKFWAKVSYNKNELF